MNDGRTESLRPGHEDGFTLFELVIAGVLMVILGIAAIPYAGGFLAGRRVWGSAGGTARLATLARQSSADYQETVTLERTQGSRYISVMAVVPRDIEPAGAGTDVSEPEPSAISRVRIPGDVKVEYSPPEDSEPPTSPASPGSSTDSGPEWAITFYPDGSCDGGTLDFTGSRGEACRVVWDAVTGKADISGVDDGE